MGSGWCVKTSDKFSLSWNVTHGSGSPLFGNISLRYGDKNYILSDNAKSSEGNAVFVPIKIVGYWVTETIQIKIADDEVNRTLVMIEAMSKTKNGVHGTAAIFLKDMSSIKKIKVKCDFLP